MKISAYLFLLIFLLASCVSEEDPFDASGSFEADETIISAETSGTILNLEIEEGQDLSAGTVVGYIDSTQTYLKKQQMEAQIEALLARRPNVSVQLASLQTQLETAEREQKRIEKLVKDDAATTKQLDDVNAQIDMLEKQIRANRSTLNISTDGINLDANTLQVQIEQLEDLLQKCRIINPVSGVVLTKYAMAHEMAAPGKALYKIADLSTIYLRVYVSGDQLSQVKLGQKVTVRTDDGSGGMNETSGTVSWVSEKAEFTPKTIQTKDERANLVYAIKVKVPNDGKYKIGMYGEILFN